MSPLHDEQDVCARAMEALEAELVLPPELEARLLSAAFDDPTARAMDALEHDLAIPKHLEARLLAAIPAEVAPSGEPASARDGARPPPSKATRDRPPAFGLWLPLAAAVALGGAVVVRSWSKPTPTGISSDSSAMQVDLEAERVAAEVAALDWNQARPWAENMAALEKLRLYLIGLASREATRRLAPRYVESVRHAFLDSGKAALEESLRHATADRAFEARRNLKMYMLLGDAQRLHADGAWLARHLTTSCTMAVSTNAAGPLSPAEVRAIVKPHVAAWIFLVETELVPGIGVDRALVDRVRSMLVGAASPFAYDEFVTHLERELANPALPATRANLVYPPLTLESVLDARTDRAALARSRVKEATGVAFEVAGTFTGGARRVILRSLDEAATTTRDDWVVGNAAADGRAAEAIARTRAIYDRRFIERWVSFLNDVDVAAPDPKNAPAVLRELGADDSPVERILAALADATRPARDDAKPDRIAKRFRGLVSFAEGDPPPLAEYSRILRALADDLEKADDDASRSALYEGARTRTRALLATLDTSSRAMLSPLLLAPLEPSAPSP